jgi:UPF0716 protein FxsA
MATQVARVPGWLLFVAFLIVPLVEIYFIIQVGQAIGAWWTILLLILDSLFGAWLIKHEGGRAWLALNSAFESGRMPTKELADGALILIGGTLMLTPGFVTDGFGILLILPFTRPFFRRILNRFISRRVTTVVGMDPRLMNGGMYGDPNKRPGPGSNGSVVQGEVLNDD